MTQAYRNVNHHDGNEYANSEVRFNGLKKADFSFIPSALAGKCQKLIEACHAMSHYPCLPDMLWQGETRDFIEINDALLHVFRKASTSRSAKKSNQAYVLIATVILSLEVLARDYAGWGQKFPAAKRRAELLVREFRSGSNAWLIDSYLYPRMRVGAGLISTLAPTEDVSPERAASVTRIKSGLFTSLAHEFSMVAMDTRQSPA